MSVQFGRLNWEGQELSRGYTDQVSALLTPYAPDGCNAHAAPGVTILYGAFHTTKESKRELQPQTSFHGAVITWDGRLDNRRELVRDLRNLVTAASTDVEIVAAAYDKWGTECLQNLIGDWALSIWEPRKRALVLAKDPIGSRHLYYSFNEDQVTWSTLLEALVLYGDQRFAICDEYIAGWLGTLFPRLDLTPYIGIHAVPPSTFVSLSAGNQCVRRYWDFNRYRKIRYRSDAEYEEHFRSALTNAVRRRLRSERPVLAELSGGMDSSAIVCVADDLILAGAAETPSLNTISWYDDSYDHTEPDWNELPYIKKVEERRGRSGYHINLAEIRRFECEAKDLLDCGFDDNRLEPTPNSRSRLSPLLAFYSAHLKSQGNRVTLSGIGGGEITGGDVPSPTPELQDLLARGRFAILSRQLAAWSAKMRKPQLLLLWNAIRELLFPSPAGILQDQLRSPWLDASFVRSHRSYFLDCPDRLQLFGPLPSLQHAINLLDADRRVLAHLSPSSELLREVRYPYLDRDFLEFMFAIPREQIVRLGQRRSLMKRALIGVIPQEVLSRRRRRFVPPKETVGAVFQERGFAQMDQVLLCDRLGIMNRERLMTALHSATRDRQEITGLLKRSLILESWLGHLVRKGVLRLSFSEVAGSFSSFIRSKTAIGTSSTS